MNRTKRVGATIIVTALALSLPGAALADDGVVVHDRVQQTTDAVPSDLTDVPVPPVTDEKPDYVTDIKPDDVADTPTDRVTDRCDIRRFAAAHDDCVSDRFPHDFNVRVLIHRLVHAGEWEKLVRLLHWLGWI